MFEVRMPQKGLTETSAYLSKWYVAAGDKVKTGDYLFAMETSKSVFDVESETDGTVIAVLYPEGDEVEIEAVVCVIGEEGETYEGATAAPAAPESAPVAAENTPAPEAPAAAPAAEVKAPEKAAPAAAAELVRNEGERVAISPRAKAKAEELGMDYSTVAPTGPEGRIIEEDILRAYEMRREEKMAEEGVSAPAFAAAPFAGTAALAPDAAALPATSVETKIFTFDAESVFAYESTLRAFPQEGRPINSVNDMILYAVSKIAAQHPEMMRGLPVFFAGSGAPYYVPALDPAAGWSLGVGTPKRELADAPDGGSKEIRSVALAFVYSTALLGRDAVDEIAKELINALEHFPAFLAMRA